MAETMFRIIGCMIFIIVFLFLLDIIIYMVKTVFGVNYKKLLMGAGAGFAFMAIRDWYKKNHVDLTDSKETVTEVVEQTEEGE